MEKRTDSVEKLERKKTEKRTSITIDLKKIKSETFQDVSADEDFTTNLNGDDDSATLRTRSAFLPQETGPYSEEFVGFLDRCYWLMDEVWRYKRSLESVEDFWERVVIEPDRIAAENLANAKNAKLVKPKSKTDFSCYDKSLLNFCK